MIIPMSSRVLCNRFEYCDVVETMGYAAYESRRRMITEGLGSAMILFEFGANDNSAAGCYSGTSDDSGNSSSVIAFQGSAILLVDK